MYEHKCIYVHRDRKTETDYFRKNYQSGTMEVMWNVKGNKWN